MGLHDSKENETVLSSEIMLRILFLFPWQELADCMSMQPHCTPSFSWGCSPCHLYPICVFLSLFFNPCVVLFVCKKSQVELDRKKSGFLDISVVFEIFGCVFLAIILAWSLFCEAGGLVFLFFFSTTWAFDLFLDLMVSVSHFRC